jgi:hypothetical protein
MILLYRSLLLALLVLLVAPCHAALSASVLFERSMSLEKNAILLAGYCPSYRDELIEAVLYFKGLRGLSDSEAMAEVDLTIEYLASDGVKMQEFKEFKARTAEEQATRCTKAVTIMAQWMTALAKAINNSKV